MRKPKESSRQMSKTGMSLALVVLLLACLPAVSVGAKQCDPDTLELIAITSAMMAAYPEELPQHFDKNRALLGEKSTFQACVPHVVKLLTDKALSSPSRREVVKASMEFASKHGRPDLAERVAEDLLENRGDLLIVAQYLNNTVNALSILLYDDLERFRHTAFYQQNAFTWHSLRALFQPEDVTAMQKITNDLHVWYFLTLSRGIQD